MNILKVVKSHNPNVHLSLTMLKGRKQATETVLGAIQKVCHTIFDQFIPPPLLNSVTHLGSPLYFTLWN